MAELEKLGHRYRIALRYVPISTTPIISNISVFVLFLPSSRHSTSYHFLSPLTIIRQTRIQEDRQVLVFTASEEFFNGFAWPVKV